MLSKNILKFHSYNISGGSDFFANRKKFAYFLFVVYLMLSFTPMQMQCEKAGGILCPFCPDVSRGTVCSCGGHGGKEDAVLQHGLHQAVTKVG